MAIQQTDPANEGANPRIYSAPRTFDFATVLVITAAYAMLFAALRAMGAPLIVIALTAGFFTVVAISQAFLFGGKKPRLASWLAGAVCTACTFLAAESDFTNATLLLIVFALIYIGFLGAFFGYLAGAIVGGVFLAAEVPRKLIRGRSESEPAAVEDENWE